jgi:large subunit ribosomal protein L4
MRKEAMRSVLVDKLRSDRLVVLNELSLEQPRTKDLLTILRRLDISVSCLVVTEKEDRNAYLSARNIPNVKQAFVDSLGVLDIISHKRLLLTQSALEALEKKLS